MIRRDLTFRVFVSSTFADLRAERDALQTQVFEPLREFCRRRGARFQAIDLRCGVSEEAGRDQQTMHICRQELERCQQLSPRPNFIVLLGNRYGWQPLPTQILQNELEELLGQFPDHEQAERALLVAEGKRGLQPRGWYRLDRNAVPAAYCLRPRSDPAESSAEGWAAIEARLQQLLRLAMDRAGWSVNDPRRAKYYDSATHQEIRWGGLQSEAARNHVFCCFCAPPPPSIVSGGTERPDLKSTESSAAAAGQRLESLKQELLNWLPQRNLFTYSAAEPAASSANRDAMCQAVRRHLKRVIRLELRAFRRLPDAQRERRAHEEFARRQARGFVGRRKLLDQMQEYLAGPDQRPLFLVGTSGSGKSALLAKAWQQCRRGLARADIVCRFIGTTPASSDLRTLLMGLCQHLADSLHMTQEPLQSVVELGRRLAELLQQASAAGRRVVVLLDALDQLAATDQSYGWPWLPRALPSGIKLIASVVDDEPQSGEAAAVPPVRASDLVLRMDSFSRKAGRRLLRNWLLSAGRTLTKRQERHILRQFRGCPSPLFLKFAFEEARRWKSWQSVPGRPDGGRGIRGTVLDVLEDFLIRLEDPRRHPEVLVRRALAALGAARFGLTEDELLDVLSADEEVLRASTKEFLQRTPGAAALPRLPLAVWARLRGDLEPYLQQRRADGAVVLSYYHRQVRVAVARRYLSQAEARQQTHRRLAAFFGQPANPFFLRQPRGGRGVANLRKLSELPYQLRCGETWAALEQTLRDLSYFQASAEAGRTFDLQRELAESLATLPPQRAGRRVLELLAEALQQDIQAVARRPELLWQSLWNSGWWFDAPAAADHYNPAPRDPGQGVQRLSRQLELWRQEQAATAPVLAWCRSVRPPPVRLGTGQSGVLRGHVGAVLDLSPSAAHGRLASCGVDGTVRVWSTRSGQELHCLGGNRGPLRHVRLSRDGRFVAGATDREVVVWEVDSERELRCLEGWHGGIRGLVISPDGDWLAVAVGSRVEIRRVVDGESRPACQAGNSPIVSLDLASAAPWLVTASADGAVRMWDATTSRHLWNRPTGSTGLARVGFAGLNESIYAIQHDTSTLVIDSRSGQEQTRFVTDRGRMACVTVSPDLSQLAAGTSEGLVRVWDAQRECETARFAGHEAGITAICYSVNGRQIISGSVDGTVRSWDARSDAQPAQLEGHTDVVTSLAVGSGEQIASGSADGTVRLWDSQTGRQLAVLTGRLPPAGQPAGGLAQGNWFWDAVTGQPAAPGRAPRIGRQSIVCVGWSPTGRLVGGASVDAIRVWNVATRQEQACMQTVGSTVWSLAVFEKGDRIAAGMADGTVRIWSTATAMQLAQLPGHACGVQHVAVSRDGGWVASTARDGSRQAWQQQGEIWNKVEWAEAVAGGCSQPECNWSLRAEADGYALHTASAERPIAWLPRYGDLVPGPVFRPWIALPSGLAWCGAFGDYVAIVRLEYAVRPVGQMQPMEMYA